MTKKIVGVIILSLVVCQKAWAGESVPEIPTGIFPLLLLGLSGAVLWIRSFIKK